MTGPYRVRSSPTRDGDEFAGEMARLMARSVPLDEVARGAGDFGVTLA
jgi:hypothetical protein